MNETPAAGPLPTGPLPRLGGMPALNQAPSSSTRPASGGEIGRHLKWALVYFGIILAMCVGGSYIGSDAAILALYAYWGALAVHALVALGLIIKSAIYQDWRALGRHVVAVLLVAAVALGACWVNMMALSAAGSSYGF